MSGAKNWLPPLLHNVVFCLLVRNDFLDDYKVRVLLNKLTLVEYPTKIRYLSIFVICFILIQLMGNEVKRRQKMLLSSLALAYFPAFSIRRFAFPRNELPLSLAASRASICAYDRAGRRLTIKINLCSKATRLILDRGLSHEI